MKDNRSLATIFLIVFIDLFGFGIILPLLPFIAEKYHATPFHVGLLTASYSLFQLIASPILGRLSDRYGRKKVLVLSQLGTMFGFLLLGFARSLPLLFISRIIDGATGGNISVAQAYIADITDKKNRAKGMGILGAAFGLGFILGPALGGVLSRISFSTPAFVAAGVSFVSIIATSFMLKETINTKKSIKTNKTKLTISKFLESFKKQPIGFLMVVFLLQNLAFAGMQSNFALWTERTFSYGPSENGTIFAFIGIMSVVTQLILLPRLVRLIGERKMLAGGLLFLSIGLLFLPYVIWPWMIYISVFFLSIGNGLSNPSLQAIASENVEKEEYGEVLGMLQSSGSVGRIVGPVMAGFLFDVYGKNIPFISSGIITLFIFGLVLQFLPRSGSVFSRAASKIRG
ncbi:MFS transporter [Patescibacteria group bacterium]